MISDDPSVSHYRTRVYLYRRHRGFAEIATHWARAGGEKLGYELMGLGLLYPERISRLSGHALPAEVHGEHVSVAEDILTHEILP